MLEWETSIPISALTVGLFILDTGQEQNQNINQLGIDLFMPALVSWGIERIIKMTLETSKPVVVKPPQPSGIVKEVVNKSTKDLYLAAAFHCEGCRLTEVDKTDRTRMIFNFEGGELADRVEREWYEGVLVVSATSYAASLRLMKSAIHS